MTVSGTKQVYAFNPVLSGPTLTGSSGYDLYIDQNKDAAGTANGDFENGTPFLQGSGSGAPQSAMGSFTLDAGGAIDATALNVITLMAPFSFNGVDTLVNDAIILGDPDTQPVPTMGTLMFELTGQPAALGAGDTIGRSGSPAHTITDDDLLFTARVSQSLSSSSTIPEPSTFAVWSVLGLAITVAYWRRHRRGAVLA